MSLQFGQMKQTEDLNQVIPKCTDGRRAGQECIILDNYGVTRDKVPPLLAGLVHASRHEAVTSQTSLSIEPSETKLISAFDPAPNETANK